MKQEPDPDEFIRRADPAQLGDPLDRSEFSLAALLQRPVPPRDYLLEGMLSTTSRWLINGETGVGKTLVGLDFANAASNGAAFLNWKGGRPCRVAYFDGELPFETLKERLVTTEKLFGVSQHGLLTIYTRDVMDARGEEMPPFNTLEGQEWLWREIERHKYNLIAFDNIMTLTAGAMDTEEAWRVMPPLMRRITASRCAQVWLHHTGHDSSRGYGTKTREWNMDTVIHLSKENPEDEDIKLEFRKARLRTPDTAYLFAPQIIRRTETGWSTDKAPASGAGLNKTDRERKRAWFAETLDEIAAGGAASPGYDGHPVHKVTLASIRDEMRRRGHISTEDGKIPGRERVAFQRAKEDLKAAGSIAVENETVWRIK